MAGCTVDLGRNGSSVKGPAIATAVSGKGS